MFIMDESIYEKLASLSEISKLQLAKILKTIHNNKDLVLEPGLIKPLERICGVSWLKSNAVEKIFKLDATSSTKRENVQIYMIYTNIKTFHKVLQHIQAQVDVINPEANKYHVICVPKSMYAFEELIEEHALWTIVRLHSFQWMPIHLDEGILSMELPHMYRDIFVMKDYTLMPAFTKSLWHLFLAFGRPNFTFTLGLNAQLMLKQLDVKIGDSEFGGLIAFDRNVDYASALLTPGTYSALLSDIYGIECGVCKEQEPEKPERELNVKQQVNFALDSKKDSVYNVIKDKYFTQVTEILRHLTKDLKVQGETSEMALHEMKRYLQTKLPSVALKKKLVSTHLNAAETIVKMLHTKLERLIDVESNILGNSSKNKSVQLLEEFLQSEGDATASLALFMLLCQTQKVPESDVKSFLHKYFLEFGFTSGFLYRNLLKANVIDAPAPGIGGVSLKIPKMSLLSTKTNFFANANKLKQIIPEPEKINLKAPNCCSYVFGGTYVPLIAQLTSLVLSGCPLEDLKSKCANLPEVDVKGQYQTAKKSLLVYVIGGITYSEIAALNLLETMMGVKIIKISDRIISKHDIANAFIKN